MWKCSLLGLVLFVSVWAKGQSPISALPPYAQKPLPTYALLRTDSTVVRSVDLPAYPYTLFVYFSPDCGHCQTEAENLNAQMDSLQNVLLVWVSYRDWQDIRRFYLQYNMARFPNVVMGRDPEYILPSFFKVRFTPYVALYDKNKKFVKAWESGIAMSELLQLVREKP